MFSKKFRMNAAASVFVVLSYPALASSVQDKVADIQARYDREWQKIRSDGDNIAARPQPEGPEVAVGVDLDVKMERQEIILDVPTVTMRLQTVALHLPQVSMRTQRIVWHEPEIFMGTVKCGQYPEFHGWTIRWKDILCDVPQTRMAQREARVDIPEFRWDRTEFKLHLPEFKMERQRWVLDLPSVTVRDVQVEIRKIQAEGEELQRRADALKNAQTREINAVVSSDLRNKRGDVNKAFTDGISSLRRGIAEVEKYGIDPRRVPDANGGHKDLIAQLNELEARKNSELAKLDQQIARMTS
jgi:hypothetical protein